MRAVIIANGVLENRPVLPGHDLLIAADGGSIHCKRYGLIPDVVIGDMDSADPIILEEFQNAGSEIIRYPARKDFTDLELALYNAVEKGASEIFIIAALGARWDQTLANLLLPAAKEFSGVRIRLVDELQDIELIKSGEKYIVHGKTGDLLSLVPLGGDAAGVTTENLEYPLNNETLHFGSTRGISNRLIGECASIYCEQGQLLCVVIHQDVEAQNVKCQE